MLLDPSLTEAPRTAQQASDLGVEIANYAKYFLSLYQYEDVAHQLRTGQFITDVLLDIVYINTSYREGFIS